MIGWYLTDITRHEAAETHGDTTDDETGVVEIQSVDPLSVTQPAKTQPRHSVGDTNHRDQERGILLINLEFLCSVHREDIWSIEANTREEVTGLRLVIGQLCKLIQDELEEYEWSFWISLYRV